MSVLRLLTLLVFLCVGAQSQAGTELEFWHSYVHRPSGRTHYSFHLSSYRRGLFIGPCGVSTRQGQWRYTFDLTGPGPIYTTSTLSVEPDSGKSPMRIRAGTIVIDSKRNRATIKLETTTNGRATDFLGNGTYRIHAIE